MTDSDLVAGEFVLQDLFSEFTYQVNRKIDAILAESHLQDSKQIMKSLQRGEDTQFDQILSALGCVAEYCLPSLLETLFKWFNQNVPNGAIKFEGKSARASVKSKSDSLVKEEDVKKELKEMIISIVFCLVLIEVLQQLSVHPLPENQIQHILSIAFTHFKSIAGVSPEAANNKARIVVDLFAEVIGVMAKTKFQHVRCKFMSELEEAKKRENNTGVIVGLIMGMKFFRVKMYPVEDFEASFRFLRELAGYSLEVKDREIKRGLTSLFVEILIPVAAAVKTEVNVPVLRDFVDALYPTSLELSKKRKFHIAMYPLVTCLLCVSQKQFFLNNWHIFLDNCLSNLKNRDQKVSRVALESLYRLLWAYTVRIKCESNTATQSRLQSIIKTLFPAGSRSVVPKDTPLSIYVKIIQFIAQERLDFAMKEIILDLLCLNAISSRTTKIMSLQPERMNIGLRAFLVITDSLQQKDGAPPMPTTVGVMPSGNTLRVKKTFLNKMLTEDEARTIGVSQYYKLVQKALDWILTTLDGQVGQRMMMTNRTSDVIGVENKPKIDLFRTCIAAMPRLIPAGSLVYSELFELLSRLTIHIDEDLRTEALACLISFAQDFPDLTDDVVGTYVSFILKQVTDIHYVLLETVLKHLMQLISGWQNKSIHSYNSTNSTPRTRKSKFTDSHDRRSKYAPLIDHLEGFALVLLCSNRSATRKLACLLLKEVKDLVRTLNYKKSGEDLVIDALDRLCPVVASEVVLEQEIPHYLSTTECKNVLVVSERCDVTALVECTSACSSNNNVDLWTSFIASFMKPNRIPAFCATAVQFSWDNVNVRVNQLWPLMDPIQTSSSKKGNVVPSSGDTLLSLWTNYIVFACRSAPTNAAAIKKQTPGAIATGTSDWLVSLSRDSERLTATPSALFQRLITLLRQESNLPLRDSAVVGLGSTSIVAFPDLMVELLTVIQEACKTHRQDNMRRKRKRDNTRVMLARVMERLARHKVLSECAASTIQLPANTHGKSNDPAFLSNNLLDYIKDMCTFLEAVDKLEFTPSSLSGNQQLPQQTPSSPFPGTLLSSASAIQTHSTPNLMDELRIHFGSMISYLMRHLPEHSQRQFLPDETRRILFFVFGRWCGKYGDALDNLDLLNEKGAKNTGTLLHITALKAECAVLCSGPLFDKSGLLHDCGYLYPWLEALLDYNNPKIHQFGREAIVMLLRHNKNEPALLSWLIDKCYTGSPLVASGCFCSIATAFNFIDLDNNTITLLNLALFSIANPQVSHTAQHLLIMIQSRIIPSLKPTNLPNDKADAYETITDTQSKEKPLLLCLNFNYERMYTPPLYCLSQYDISRDLARLHPEFTIAMLSEVFRRFMLTTTTVWQQLMLEYMIPWLKNIELSMHDNEERVPELNNSEKMFEVPLHMLASCGWGSANATLFVLSNLTYMTIRYHTILGNEIENCWTTLCHTWPGNLDILLFYVSGLSACGGSESIAFVTRMLITYFARAKPKEVAQYLVSECQVSDLPNFGTEIIDQPPYLKMQVPSLKVLSRLRLSQTTSPPRSLVIRNNKNSHHILSSSAPTSYLRINTTKTDSSGVITSPNVRNPTPKPISNLTHSLPHHKSLQNIDLSKTSEFYSPTKPPPRPVSVRAKMSSSLYSLPNLSSETNVTVSPRSASSNRLSHHEPLADPQFMAKLGLTNQPKSRLTEKQAASKDAPTVVPEDKEKNVFTKWRQQIELGHPCALPLPTTPLFYFHLNEYFVIDHIQKSNGLLRSNIACVLLSEIVAKHGVVTDWKNYLPTLLLSIFLGMDVGYEEVPQKCQFLLSHIIIQLLAPKDQAVFASSVITDNNDAFFDDITASLNHLKKGTSPTSVSTTDSGIEAGSSPRNEHPLLRQRPKGDEAGNQKPFDIQSLSAYIQSLLEAPLGQLWASEDASPKSTVLKSTEKLTTFVSTVLSVVESLIPDFGLSKKLAKQTLTFSTHTNDKHCAARALQIFRSLNMPLRQKDITDLSMSLSDCIAEGSDLAFQSWAIEILLTLLQTCEISNAFLSKNDMKTSSSKEKRRSQILPITSNGLPPTVPPVADCPSQSPSVSKSKSKMKRGHVHRRSGSMTISKKVLDEATIVEPELPPTYEVTPVNTSNAVDDRNPAQSIGQDCSYPYIAPSKSRPTSGVQLIVDEWKNGLAQIFWMAIGILESDFEHEYLIALQIIQKALVNLPLNENDGRMRLERSFNQIQWSNFKGLQSLLMKGLTCNITFDTAFAILCNLTIVTHLHLVSFEQDGSGFAMNVIALLPRLVNNFGDPDVICCDCAQNIAQVCVEHFKDYIKLQSLAHVMSLYSNNTYNKSVQTWVNVVCKYVYETFPQALVAQLTFLTEMLEKGHSSFHLSCLHITHSLLSLSSILSERSHNTLTHELLHVIAKHLNLKHWKESLSILKLAVSRSSQLASPASAFTVTQGAAEKEKIELPGLTLSFKLDMPETNELSPRRSPDGKEISSPLGSGWRRPHLSQRRTRERIRCVLSVCSPNYDYQDGAPALLKRVSDSDLTSPSHLSDMMDEGSSAETEESGMEDKSGVDEFQFHGVFRDFDFLDEIEEINDEMSDKFNQGMHWSPSTSGAVELIEADEPEECDLTPAVSNIPDESEMEENQLSDDSDTVSTSSLDSASSLGPEPNPVSQSSTELVSEFDDKQLAEELPGITVNAKSLTLERHRTFSNKSANTYIRAVSPSPPGLSRSKEVRVFSPRKSITDQVNALSTDSESVSSEDNIQPLIPNVPPPSFESSDRGPLPRVSTASSPEKAPSSSTSFQSLEKRAESIGSLIQFSKSDSDSPVPWNEPTLLHVKNLRWKANVLAVAEDSNGNALSKFFLTFPSIYRSLCVDFSVLSKDGCSHLGSQLSAISSNFSSMVVELPEQLKCPLCVATVETHCVLLEQLKSHVNDLEKQLDFYSTKQETAYEYLDVIRNFSSGDKAENAEVENDDEAALEQKQIELCRLLYTLHFQLLLIFQNFNRLVHVISSAFPRDPSISDQLINLHKQLLVHEDVKDQFDSNPHMEQFTDVEDDMRSMTNEEASHSLLSRLEDNDFKNAHIQLCILRKLWQGDTFGSREDSASDFLTHLYFQKTYGANSNSAIYAIIGENVTSQSLCEKLKEVNMQIQHSLKLLEKPRGKSPHESHSKSLSVAASSSIKPLTDLSLKRTSF